MRPLESAQILEARSLTAGQWAAIESRQREAIRHELERGKSMLRKAYDASYIEQIERERGPITAEEYARVVVAGERGAAAAILAELQLPSESHMRLERVWMHRCAGDAHLAKRTRRAIAVAREA